MLTIKREGWLWKCLTSGQRSLIETFGTSVCELFWMLLANLLLVLFMITCVVGVGFVTLPSIIHAGLFYMGVESFINEGMLAISTTVNFFIGGVWILSILKDNLNTTTITNNITIPSIVKEYVKAKKEKVCPVVRVDD